MTDTISLNTVENPPRGSEIRVGVTGHRWNKMSRKCLPELRARLRDVMARIDQRSGGRMDGDRQQVSITLVSGMAEGTDLAAATTRPAHWALEAALPLPLAAWRSHLAGIGDVTDLEMFDLAIRQASVTDLSDQSGQPTFTALAQYIADSCDVLIAIWDGQAGGPGGTSDVVTRAKARGIEIHIMPPPNPRDLNA